MFDITKMYAGIDSAKTGGKPVVERGDYLGSVQQVESAVGNFLQKNAIARPIENGSMIAMESFSVDRFDKEISGSNLIQLCQEVGIPAEYQASAAKTIANIIARFAQSAGNTAGRGTAMFGAYLNQASIDGNHSLNYSDLFPAEALRKIDGEKFVSAMEAFGVGYNDLQADMKTTISVAMVALRKAWSSKLCPVVPTSQSTIVIKREEFNIYDMSKADKERVRMVEVYRDPDMIEGILPKMSLLKANDSAGDFLLADNVLKFGVDANVRKLAINSAEFGMDKINHTDVLADNVKIDSVMINIGTPAGDSGTPAAVDEQILIPISSLRSGLTHTPNGLSTERQATVVFEHFIDKDTKKVPTTASNTETSTVLSTLGVNDAIRLSIAVTATINLETGVVSAFGKVAFSGINKTGGAIASAVTTLLGKLNAGTGKLYGYSLDVRKHEANMRRAALRGSIDASQRQLELQAGRVIVTDWMFGQQIPEAAAARCAQLETVIRDNKNYGIITDVCRNVNAEQEQAKLYPTANKFDIAKYYAAGSIVNPCVLIKQLNFSNVVSVRSSDASGDLKQYLRTYLNEYTSELLSVSGIKNELAAGSKFRMRALVEVGVAGKILHARHIHQHLDNTTRAGDGDIDCVIELDNGVEIEVVTTTFTKAANQMIILPWVGNNDSILNFGLNYDQGPLAGNYTSSEGDSAKQRVFTMARELLIPTNAVALIVELSGL